MSSAVVTNSYSSVEVAKWALNIGSFFWLSTIGIAPCFFLEFAEKSHITKKPIFYIPTILISVLFFISQCLYGTIIEINFSDEYSYGRRFIYPVSVWSYLCYVYAFTYVFAGILVCINYYRLIRDPLRKTQLRAIIMFGIIMLSAAGVLDFLLPLSGFNAFPNFVSNILLLIWTFSLIRNIYKHKLFNVSPVIASESMMETMTDILFLTNWQGLVKWANSSAYNLLNRPELKLLDRPVADLFVTDDYFDLVKEQKTVRDKEDQLVIKGKKNLDVSVSAAPMVDKSSGTLLGGVYVCRDISDRKLAEENLKNSLIEKETLLREIHHRVKNNIQIIISMLRIKSRNTDNEETVSILKQTQSRIETMSLVHNILYQAKNIKFIPLEGYFTDIITAIRNMLEMPGQHFEFDLKCDDTELEINQAIPCGLILNEIVTNAFKHAFIGMKVGRISIQLETEKDLVHLKIADNGVGISENIDFQATRSLGLGLIKLLTVNQLRGEITLSRTEGSQFNIMFQRNTDN